MAWPGLDLNSLGLDGLATFDGAGCLHALRLSRIPTASCTAQRARTILVTVRYALQLHVVSRPLENLKANTENLKFSHSKVKPSLEDEKFDWSSKGSQKPSFLENLMP